MIVNINPVTVVDVTTDKAIVNVSIGDASVAMSLYPAQLVDGVWVRVSGAEAIPVVGSFPDFMTAVESVAQVLVSAVGV